MSHVPSRSLLAALCICLTACTASLPPLSTPPMPPPVHCEQGPTPSVPAPPVDWLRDGPAWAAQVLRLLERERLLRTREHGCLRALRAEGIIQ